MSIEFLRQDGTPASTSFSFFPGGEPLLAVEAEAGADELALVRGAFANDLVILSLWANSVRRSGARPTVLMPYLPGARADHREHAVGFDAVAYARLINAASLDQIVCVDPHSPVMPTLLHRCEIIEAADLVYQSLPDDVRETLVGVIAPDEGARARALQVAEQLELTMFQAHKQRDFATGRLSGFTCDPLPPTGAFLVVDDICDGGGTFRGLATAAGVGRERLHLWVSHGIFSGAAHGLVDHYCSITTTDSHPGCHNIPGVRVVNLLPHLMGSLDKGVPS